MSIDHPSKRSFFLVDPDGMRNEFYSRRNGGVVDLAAESEEMRAYIV